MRKKRVKIHSLNIVFTKKILFDIYSMIKSEISIVIKPISSLYDLLPNDKMSNYLDELSKDFGEFIENQTINKKDSHIDDKINKLKFNSYIENTEGVFHYIIMPYKDDVLDQTYNNNIE